MNVIKPQVEIIMPPSYEQVLKKLEICGRTCYKSEGKITDDSAEQFVAGLIKRGHEAVIEHESLTLRFICDRGVSHEIVRHRIASYCQESTRYCNYAKDEFNNEITVIEPSYLKKGTLSYKDWNASCRASERMYFDMLNMGCTPQEARAVLPNSLKTELVMTANLREWRHFFKLRCSPAAHPQMREVAKMGLEQCKSLLPIIFEDIVTD